jgi:hypothetical protein
MCIGKLLIVANQPSKVGIRSYTLFSDKRKFKLMSLSNSKNRFCWHETCWHETCLLFSEKAGCDTPEHLAQPWTKPMTEVWFQVNMAQSILITLDCSKNTTFKKNTRTQFQIYICMSAIPGMYLICHQIHWKNLLGPNPTCNSTGSKVTFGKRTSAELAVHARSIFPTQPRCIVCHRPPATSPVPQRCQWGLPFCKCYDAKLLWALKSGHSQ